MNKTKLINKERIAEIKKEHKDSIEVMAAICLLEHVQEKYKLKKRFKEVKQHKRLIVNDVKVK